MVEATLDKVHEIPHLFPIVKASPSYRMLDFAFFEPIQKFYVFAEALALGRESRSGRWAVKR